MWNKVLEPDNLKIIVPVLIGLVAACVGFASAFIVAIVGHVLNRKAKVSDIRVTRGYDLAEKIAQGVQQLEEGCRMFEQFYHENYRNLIDREGALERAMENFDRSPLLFQDIYHSLQEHEKERAAVSTLLRGAWLYLPRRVVGTAQSYLELGNYVFQSAVEGEHNQHLMFFQNLLDAERRKERQKLYNRFVKQMTGLKL